MSLRYKNKRAYRVLSIGLLIVLLGLGYYTYKLNNVSSELKTFGNKTSTLNKIYELNSYLKAYSYEANKAINSPDKYSMEDFKLNPIYQEIEAITAYLEDEKISSNFNSYNVALGAMLEAFKKDAYTDKSIKQFFTIMENTLNNIYTRINELKELDNIHKDNLEYVKVLRNISLMLFIFILLIFISLMYYLKRISIFTNLVEETIEGIADGDSSKSPYIYTKDFEGIAHKLNHLKSEVLKRDEEVRNIITTLEREKAESDAWYQYFITVLNSFNKPVVVLDTFIKIGFINKEALSFLGLKKDLDFINKPLSDISCLKNIKDLNEKIGDSIFNLKSFFVKSEISVDSKKYKIKISIMPLVKNQDSLGAICIIDIL